jgi:hypothetical protein
MARVWRHARNMRVTNPRAALVNSQPGRTVVTNSRIGDAGGGYGKVIVTNPRGNTGGGGMWDSRVARGESRNGS